MGVDHCDKHLALGRYRGRKPAAQFGLPGRLQGSWHGRSRMSATSRIGAKGGPRVVFGPHVRGLFAIGWTRLARLRVRLHLGIGGSWLQTVIG